MNAGNRWYARYGLTAVIVLAGFLLRLWLVPVIGAGTIYIVAFPAMIMAAVFFGSGPAVFGAVLSIALTELFIVEPIGRINLSLSLAIRTFILLLTSFYIGHISHELRLANERFKLAQRASGAGVWDWDMLTGKLEWSLEIFRIFGLDPIRDKPTFDVWRTALHPEDRHLMEDRIKQAVAGRAMFNSDYRVVLPTGEKRWVTALGNAFYDDSGKPVRMSGICFDITAQKETEEALRFSQEDLNRAQAVAHAGSWRLDVNKNELTWSDENHRIFGVPKDTAMTYETFLGAVHPEDRRYVDEKWLAALRGEPYDIEHRIVVDGRIKWVREKATLEFDGQGKLLGGFGTTQDISERKQAQEDLSNEKANLQKIFDIVNVGMFLIDQNGAVKQVNQAVLKWIAKKTLPRLNARPGDILGCIHARINDGECRESLQCSSCVIHKTIETVLRTKESIHDLEAKSTLVVEGKEMHLWFLVSADPLVLDGQAHVLLALKDITVRKRTEETLLTSHEELENRVWERTVELAKARDHLNKAKRLSDIGTLAATVAHELRNPLAAIKMATYNIRRKSKDSALDSHLKNIDVKVNESEQIISNLLFYSKIKLPRLENINIGNILNVCLQEAQERFEKKRVLVDKDLESIKDMLVKADALQLKEVFSNIFNNSFDALPDQGGKLVVRSRNSDGSVRIMFSDNGEGIDAEVLKRVFEPFFTTKAKGTGLGLSLCHQIMHLHNGSIEIDSKKGGYTAVTLTLPLENKEDAEKNIVSG